MLCLPRLSRPDIYWFHVLSAGIVRSSNRKDTRSATSVPIMLVSLQVRPTTEIAAGPQYTSRYSKGGTAVAERANQTLATIVHCLKLVRFPIALSPSSTIQLRISIIVYHIVEQEMKRRPTSSFTTRSQILATYEPLIVQLTSTNLAKFDPRSILLSATTLVKIVNTVFWWITKLARLLRLKMLPLLRTFRTYLCHCPSELVLDSTSVSDSTDSDAATDSWLQLGYRH